MKILRLIFFLAVPIVAGSIGALAPSGQGYSELVRPAFSPPGWVFGPVWSILYILIGISGYLAWQAGRKQDRRAAFTVYFFQLFLNSIWTLIFFGLGQRFWALIEIIILLIFITANIVLFYKLSKTAAYLLVPYLLWVAFASVLTFSVWRLNI
ncbi:tryptophan-rich sensory protein [Candidatus Falkowbacteria bacterium]|nr:tryptophan-rich sensory protein [Candidatus Falkowbacteria bacterium]